MRDGVTNPSNEQLIGARKKAAEEYFAIHFLYMPDFHRYGKVIQDMENAVLCRKDTFPKMLSDPCRLLNG